MKNVCDGVTGWTLKVDTRCYGFLAILELPNGLKGKEVERGYIHSWWALCNHGILETALEKYGWKLALDKLEEHYSRELPVQEFQNILHMLRLEIELSNEERSVLASYLVSQDYKFGMEDEEE